MNFAWEKCDLSIELKHDTISRYYMFFFSTAPMTHTYIIIIADS